jgi:hypothetical protein
MVGDGELMGEEEVAGQLGSPTSVVSTSSCKWALADKEAMMIADIQIDLLNRHLTNNDVRLFSTEMIELRCKLLFIICRLCIYIESSALLVHLGCPP